MNNHKRSRRNRPMDTGRSHQGTRRSTGQQNSVSASQTLHGLYSDQRCCHSVSVMTGCTVQVSVKKGLLYEGILVTVSPDKAFVLEAVHVVEKKTSEGPSIPSEMIDKIIFPFKDIVYVKAKDCDIEYAVKGDSFLTDTEISDRNRGINGQTERELEEWTVDAEDAKIDHSLEGGSDMANGWSAEDMFKTNQEKFAVQTVYDETMADYTTQLDKEDTKEYRDRKDRAERLAREIEASPDHARNAALESSDGDEEQKYSSVVRPGYAGHGHNNNKYIPPHLRSHSGGSNPGNQPPRLRSPQNRQMHNTSQMSRPQSRTPPQAHSPQPPQHHPPPHHMMQQGHPAMRHPHPHAHPPHPSQLQLHRSPNQGGPPPQHISPNQQRLPPPQHIPHLTSPRSPQQQGMHPGHLRTPPQSIPHPQMSPRQQPPPPQEHRGSPVSPIQLRNTTPDLIREENKPYVDSSESSKTLNSTSRKTPSSPQPAASADSIPTSPGAPVESSTENPSKVPEDEKVAELKEWGKSFQLSPAISSSSEPKAISTSNNLASKPSTNTSCNTITSVASTSAATLTTPSDAQSVDKTRTATEALEKKESEPEKSDPVKKYTLNPNAKEFNPNAKPFVPSKVLSHPTKTPTPPRPQSQPSPVLVQHGPMQSFIMVPPVNPQKMQQYVKKTASNMPPHQRQQQPDIPHGIPVSVAAGQPIITHMGFQPGGQIMYPVQQGGQTPQGMGPPVIPQPQPYQPYQPPLPYTKQPPMFRQVTPQANIPNAAPHQGAQGIQQVPEGNHPQVHVVSNQAALQAQHQAAVAMQQAQQQQQQQQQQQHFAHQQIQQHQQAAPHLQPQTHPHAQPNNTPPQQGQHTQQNQPSGPTMQQQQQGQGPQHTGRPSPSPVHHIPQQMTHMTQAQMQHPHASQQAQLLYQSSLQPVTSQPVPGQQLQSPQSLHPQHPFSGTHPTQLQLHYPPSSNIQAPNITSVTPVHSHPHPHPQQAGVFYIQNPNQAGQAGGGQAGMQYPSVSGAGQHMTGPYLQAAQGSGPGQPQQPVQYQQGN